jgi:hypothetical protein
MNFLMSEGENQIVDEIQEMAKNVEKVKIQEKEINEPNNKVVVDSEAVKMQKSTLALGLDGIKLTDTDVFSIKVLHVDVLSHSCCPKCLQM